MPAQSITQLLQPLTHDAGGLCGLHEVVISEGVHKRDQPGETAAAGLWALAVIISPQSLMTTSRPHFIRISVLLAIWVTSWEGSSLKAAAALHYSSKKTMLHHKSTHALLLS
jgi:hypothetical protein